MNLFIYKFWILVKSHIYLVLLITSYSNATGYKLQECNSVVGYKLQ